VPVPGSVWVPPFSARAVAGSVSKWVASEARRPQAGRYVGKQGGRDGDGQNAKMHTEDDKAGDGEPF
jgi:hypothetical protein